MRRAWSEAAEAKLAALYSTTPLPRLAFLLKRTEKAIRSRAKVLGIKKGERHFWSRAELATLKRCYPNQRGQDVADALGLEVGSVHRKAAELGIKKSARFLASDLSGRVARGKQNPAMIATQFKKGQAPANKGLRRPGWAAGRMAETQFTTGRPASESHNYLPIGTEKFDAKRGVIVRKLTDDPALYPAARWRPVHTLVWESQHGTVPQGHIVVFRPGMKTHDSALITIDRLECVSLAENMRRNSYHTRYPELAPLIQLKGALNRKINRRTRQEHAA